MSGHPLPSTPQQPPPGHEPESRPVEQAPAPEPEKPLTVGKLGAGVLIAVCGHLTKKLIDWLLGLKKCD